MKTKNEIIKILKESKETILTRYKTKEIGLFGSATRNEQKESSDIDILVDFKDDADIFDLVGLALFLEEKLGQKVDVVPKRAVREEIKSTVLSELISV